MYKLALSLIIGSLDINMPFQIVLLLKGFLQLFPIYLSELILEKYMKISRI